MYTALLPHLSYSERGAVNVNLPPPYITSLSDLIFTHLWSVRVWNSVQASDIMTDNIRPLSKIFLTNSCIELWKVYTSFMKEVIFM